MTYIYDVLLNFTDKRLIEFFEWDKNDIIENVKIIPIIRVSSNTLYDLINYNIKLDNKHLADIKNQTNTYKRTTDLEYTALFTDLNKVVGIEFSKEGEILCRSGLLLDEEEDIINECLNISEEKLIYTKNEKIIRTGFYTRDEEKKRTYLLKELDIIYEKQDKEKLNYLFNELYPKSKLSFKNKYLKLKHEIDKCYSPKYNILYEILKLTYTKK